MTEMHPANGAKTPPERVPWQVRPFQVLAIVLLSLGLLTSTGANQLGWHLPGGTRRELAMMGVTLIFASVAITFVVTYAHFKAWKYIRARLREQEQTNSAPE
jgi:DMSO/TMAO reductase YedYZ heme-binding membrane subunit